MVEDEFGDFRAFKLFNMQSLRFKAIDNLTFLSDEVSVKSPSKVTPIFGENVFTLKVAREYVNDEAYKSLVSSINSGQISTGQLQTKLQRE